MEKYFLSSLDSYIFEEVRECIVSKRMKLDNRDFLCLKIHPSLFINNKEIFEIGVVSRYKEETLNPIKKIPCFVNVLISDQKDFSHTALSQMKIEDFQFIAICELYRTKEDAQLHNFG